VLPQFVRTLASRAAVLALLAAAAAVPARAADPVIATAGGHPITQSELDQAIHARYRQAALEALARRALIDQAAAAAGVTVSDGDVDAAMASLKAAGSNGDDSLFRASLGRQGLTPEIEREAVRDELVARKIAAAQTRLEDSDYDQVEVDRIVAPTEDVARQIYASLSKGGALTEFGRVATIEPAMTVLRYDGRFSPEFLTSLFTLRPGEYSTPAPSVSPAGFAVLKMKEFRPGVTLSSSDRQVWEKFLLTQKTATHLQDWWANLEKQVVVAVGTGGAERGVTAGGSAPTAPKVLSPGADIGVRAVPRPLGSGH
jgi:parvulin-like peptidyl-prolyl isomerase